MIQCDIDYFNHDLDYVANEERYGEIKREILGEDFESDDGDDEQDDQVGGSEDEDEGMLGMACRDALCSTARFDRVFMCVCVCVCVFCW
jgi:hypothetical protein